MKKIIVFFISLVLSLFISEMILRSLGYKPGVFLSNKEIQNYWYEYDQGNMQIYDFLKPDSFGIFKVNQELIRKENNPPSNFKHIIQSLKHSSFNTDGFRGKEFAKKEKGKTCIFFVGDSYTFGFDAEPFDSSYVNVLENINKNYFTYNGGVPGADLATYATVAEKYIPRIKPDLVVVCISTDDGVNYNKELHPYENSDIYLTSKGLLFKADYSYSKDSVQVFNDAEDAYNNLIIRYSSKYVKPGWLKWIVDRSVISTLIAGRFLYKPDLSIFKNKTVMPKKDYSRQYADRIINTARANHAELIFTIIPKKCDETNEIKQVKNLVGDSVKLFYPTGISMKRHYGQYHKAHFNNNGHRFYAEFLNKIIPEVLKHK